MKNIRLLLSILLLWAVPLPVGAQQQDSLVYTVVDQLPEFIGFLPAYFAQKIRVLQDDIEGGFTGKLQATFVMTKTGEVRNVELNNRP